MAQTIWKGAISFGLVSIPVRLYAATDERGVAMHQVHAADGGRIRYRRVCEIDGKEVAYRDIAKGYQLPDGDMIVLTDEDLSQLPLASSKTVEVLQFVPASDIDPINFARTYYLEADGQGDKPYILLRDALKRTEKLAVVKVALRSRESLAVLRPYGDLIVLQMMLWPDEVRDAEAFIPDEDVSVRPQEIDMAESYIEALTGEFDPSEYTDQYREALNEVIEAKAAGRPIREEPAPAEEAGEAVDLMEALRRSVAEAKARRGEQRGGGGVVSGRETAATSPAAKKTPARKAPAKKAPAKKAPAKKAPAKKTATKKAAAKRGTARSEKASA